MDAKRSYDPYHGDEDSGWGVATYLVARGSAPKAWRGEGPSRWHEHSQRVAASGHAAPRLCTTQPTAREQISSAGR